MKKIYLFLVQTLMVFGLVFTVGCNREKGGWIIPEINQLPACVVTNPQNNAQFTVNENITVTVTADDSDGFITEVQLHVDDAEHSFKTVFPYNFIIHAGELSYGTHTLKAIAKDNEGDKGEASTVNIIIKVSIGDHYQGGIIAYVDNTGEHGIIAASNDQSAGIRWYAGTYVTTGATGTEIGTGKSNTTKIVQMQGAGNYAAKVCDDLVLNGYDDWYLPSRDELNMLYQNRNLIGEFNITTGFYWSSSEGSGSSANTVWYQDFSSGFQDYSNKIGTYRVRAVRAF